MASSGVWLLLLAVATMHDKVLLIVEAASPSPAGASVRAALAQWPEAQRPPIETITLETLRADPRVLDHCALCWLVLPASDPLPLGERVRVRAASSSSPVPGLHDFTALLQDRQIPCLITHTNTRTHDIIRANLDKYPQPGPTSQLHSPSLLRRGFERCDRSASNHAAPRIACALSDSDRVGVCTPGFS